MRRSWKATDWATFSPTTGKDKPLHFELPTYFEHVPASGEDFSRALADYRAPAPPVPSNESSGSGNSNGNGLVQIRGLIKKDATPPEKWRW